MNISLSVNQFKNRIKNHFRKIRRVNISGYKDRMDNEIANYKDVENVHDLPDIFHYWSNKYLLPIMSSLEINGINEFFAEYIIDICKRNPERTIEVVSIGSGNCDQEVDLCKIIVGEEIHNFNFTCLDINPSMLDRGRELATTHDVITYMDFLASDINSLKVEKKYDVCIANQSLHHFLELEVLFDKVKKFISPDGYFLTSDIIGRNGHMRWPEALDVINEIWKDMPDRYKYNHILKRVEKEYENWDCSSDCFEGIRAQDIMPLLLDNFYFEKFCVFGNLIDIFVDRAFGHNFDVNNPDDLRFIDKVALLDEKYILEGKVKPTHLIAAMKNSPCETLYYKNLSPSFAVRNPIDQEQ